ncbi:MAG: helix-turn-helix domain-containing protein [Rhodovibrionaceae bacterium]|nr:helix-turn-helix domain-containing protein [Rhodovibrionaceae bacterium]
MSGTIQRGDFTAGELRQLSRKERDGRVRVRMIMIAHMLDGMGREQASQAVGLSRQAAYDWAARYEARGLRGLRDRPRCGRPRKIDRKTAEALRKRLHAHAEQMGEDISAIRGVDVQHILREEFDIDYSLSATYVLLRRLGLKGAG